ncbi:ABC transporter permease, partial [Schumannella luteola]
GDDSIPLGVVQALSVSPPVHLLDASSTAGVLGYFVAIGFGLVFFVSAMTFGQTIAQSVVEEKQTRVIEILLATIPTRALLAGKILGTTILALGQIVLLLAIAVTGLTITGQGALLAGLGLPFAWFAVFFVLGFMLLAALFAATGAMVSRQEDIGSTTTPVTMLVMLPYLIVVFFNDNDLVVRIMSYVPFSAPIGMPLRLFQGDAAWWEPILSLAILAATCVGVIALGARIYENSLLRLGQRVRWAEALRG